METRPCKRCDGVGQVKDFISPHNMIRCRRCNGVGQFEEPDYDDILKHCLSSKGKNKGGVKTSRPSENLGSRVYYVWRMLRFDTGADVTLPIMAETFIHGDPWVKELGDFASEVAKKLTGGHSVGAMRWGKALGIL